jgi:hypothetical protein
VLVGCALSAYWSMFDGFQRYDDEGFTDYTISLVAHGHPLYHSVIGYGPFPYELWGGLFALSGHPLTIDAGRLITWVLWVATSLLIGLTAQRLTGRLTLGVISQVLSFTVLSALTKEPMYPGGNIAEMLMLLVAVAAFCGATRPRASLVAFGVLLAASLLTKVNAGGFAIIAVAYSVVVVLPGLRSWRTLRWLVTAAMVLVAPVLMSADLGHEWAQNYALLVAASALALVLVTYRGGPAYPDDRALARVWAQWLVGAGVLTLVVILGIALLMGSSPSDLYRGIIGTPSSQKNIFAIPLQLDSSIVYPAIAAVAGAWVVRERMTVGDAEGGTPSLVGALLRVGAGLAIWFSLAAASPFNLLDSFPGRPLSLGLVLAWVAAVPTASASGDLWPRLLRVLVPSLAVIGTLVAYPVAGTQVQMGTVPFVLCGALCVGDGWNELQAWSAASRAGADRRTPWAVMSALTAALALALAIHQVGRPMETARSAYVADTALPLSGATRVHVDAQLAGNIVQLASLLRARCRSVITFPAMMSVNYWSGLPPPSTLFAETFWSVLQPAQQQAVIAAAEAAPGLCEVRNQDEINFWLEGRPLPQVPLVRFLETSFSPLASEGPYQVFVRNA